MPDKLQFQVGFRLPVLPLARELAVSVLTNAGVDFLGLVEEEGRRERVLSFYFNDRKSAAEMTRKLRGLKLKKAVFFQKTHRRSDWESRWKKGWKPFPLTRRFHVIPLWQDDRCCPKGKEPIYLDTTNAFGTGLHETTHFTSMLIEGLAGKFGTFLDVGTGTGLLAMVALKCGARRVVAVDIDPSAVTVARQNLKANGLACSLKVSDVNDYKPACPFDLVAANLVSPDLIEFRDTIVALVKPGGKLIISGISRGNISPVKKFFISPKRRLLKVLKGREWAAMSFQL